jgi:transcriptional regulator with GAF, ATPase, and Fis domain
VISVPVELGPGASGLLYADILDCGTADRSIGFVPRDLDFAVAFAEVVAWRSTRLRSERLHRDVQRLRDQLASSSDFPSIITQNESLRETLSRVRMVVDTDISILLLGETGTGKDLLARAIHFSSSRRDRRFVSVNCAALPESLLESELFGVRRGAFTGADRDKPGLFEEADGGTFFLDEIGEMPSSLQAKLLRLLENKELTRLGDTHPRHVDVRVISATNRDLAGASADGTFRRDLFYRLAPLTFTLSPLRERREDILPLIDHFLARVCDEAGKQVKILPETIRLMCAYNWPGNVRELENEVRKLILLAGPSGEVTPTCLAQKFLEPSESPGHSDTVDLPDEFSLYDHMAQIERRFITLALINANGIKKHAATRLGMPESTLRLKMKQYDLDIET